MSKPVTLLDYGSGNIFSVTRALEHCGARVDLSHDPAVIDAAERVVLPGVGAFADGMRGLQERGLVEAVQRVAREGRPLLGICLGMQMLATRSEEFGDHAGLGIIPGKVVPIPAVTAEGGKHRIPHIGWANLTAPAGGTCDGSIFAPFTKGISVYLVHSFHLVPDRDEHRLAECLYGGHRIAAAVQSGMTIGCQFHPEKSGPAGLELLAGFLRL
jgi:imidazole glycerol-phosphate synthase subunit HisH